MCSNRNLRWKTLEAKKILDHWEMCSNRNSLNEDLSEDMILDHWEMCSNRNVARFQFAPFLF